FKVERFTYPLMTPSAARGILDSIYVKPGQFRWQVKRIEVLRQPQFISLRRNEVKDVISTPLVKKWMRGTAEPTPIWADGDRDLLGTDVKGRTQRQTVALKEVRYRIHAEIRPWPRFSARQQDFEAQFRRRAAAGKCFQQPYFGCREFPAYFRLLERDSEMQAPAGVDLDLGYMLYDVFDLRRPGSPRSKPAISLFPAQVEAGVLKVPEMDAPEVVRVEQEEA
ncbi:MAG TPA: type I-C CRISPR-associated protein Cas5c, partial [Acidobacteriota bacterium]|nr:type I-C CRISPR-associated protein Cas5c [Acidobacteriota bacterium]